MKSQKKIILLGYMGSGKSSVGKTLSEKINLNFVDLDNFISEEEKMPISEIFKQKGEIYFRKKEAQTLVSLLQSPEKMIISVGGGTPCFGDNMQKIIQNTPNVFFLHASSRELTERLFPEKEHRPLIAHLPDKPALQDFINKHLFDRNPFYTQAHHTIKTDGISAEQIAEQIIQKL